MRLKFSLCIAIMLAGSFLHAAADDIHIKIVTQPTQPLLNPDIIGLEVHPDWHSYKITYESPDADRATNVLLVLSKSPSIQSPEDLHTLAEKIAEQQPHTKTHALFKIICQTETSKLRPEKNDLKELVFLNLSLREGDCSITYIDRNEHGVKHTFDHTEFFHIGRLYARCTTVICNPTNLQNISDLMYTESIPCAQEIAQQAQTKDPTQAFNFVVNLKKYTNDITRIRI